MDTPKPKKRSGKKKGRGRGGGETRQSTSLLENGVSTSYLRERRRSKPNGRNYSNGGDSDGLQDFSKMMGEVKVKQERGRQHRNAFQTNRNTAYVQKAQLEEKLKSIGQRKSMIADFEREQNKLVLEIKRGVSMEEAVHSYESSLTSWSGDEMQTDAKRVQGAVMDGRNPFKGRSKTHINSFKAKNNAHINPFKAGNKMHAKSSRKVTVRKSNGEAGSSKEEQGSPWPVSNGREHINERINSGDEEMVDARNVFKLDARNSIQPKKKMYPLLKQDLRDDTARKLFGSSDRIASQTDVRASYRDDNSARRGERANQQQRLSSLQFQQSMEARKKHSRWKEEQRRNAEQKNDPQDQPSYNAVPHPIAAPPDPIVVSQPIAVPRPIVVPHPSDLTWKKSSNTDPFSKSELKLSTATSEEMQQLFMNLTGVLNIKVRVEEASRLNRSLETRIAKLKEKIRIKETDKLKRIMEGRIKKNKEQLKISKRQRLANIQETSAADADAAKTESLSREALERIANIKLGKYSSQELARQDLDSDTALEHMAQIQINPDNEQDMREENQEQIVGKYVEGSKQIHEQNMCLGRIEDKAAAEETNQPGEEGRERNDPGEGRERNDHVSKWLQEVEKASQSSEHTHAQTDDVQDELNLPVEELHETRIALQQAAEVNLFDLDNSVFLSSDEDINNKNNVVEEKATDILATNSAKAVEEKARDILAKKSANAVKEKARDILAKKSVVSVAKKSASANTIRIGGRSVNVAKVFASRKAKEDTTGLAPAQADNTNAASIVDDNKVDTLKVNKLKNAANDVDSRKVVKNSEAKTQKLPSYRKRESQQQSDANQERACKRTASKDEIQAAKMDKPGRNLSHQSGKECANTATISPRLIAKQVLTSATSQSPTVSTASAASKQSSSSAPATGACVQKQQVVHSSVHAPVAHSSRATVGTAVGGTNGRTTASVQNGGYGNETWNKLRGSRCNSDASSLSTDSRDLANLRPATPTPLSTTQQRLANIQETSAADAAKTESLSREALERIGNIKLGKYSSQELARQDLDSDKALVHMGQIQINPDNEQDMREEIGDGNKDDDGIKQIHEQVTANYEMMGEIREEHREDLRECAAEDENEDGEGKEEENCKREMEEEFRRMEANARQNEKRRLNAAAAAAVVDSDDDDDLDIDELLKSP